MGVEWSLSSSGLRFEGNRSWCPPLTREQRLLDQLCRRGLLEEWEDGLVLPFRRLYDLAPEERLILGLPEPARLTVHLGSRGIPGNPGFSVTSAIRHPEFGRLDGFVRRVGPFFLPYAARPILVSSPVYSLLEALDRGPAGSSIEDHFSFLGEVQELGKACGAILEGLLSREEYEFPEAVDLEIRESSPERIEFVPRIRGFYAEERLQQVIGVGTLPRVHFVAQGRSRRRFVFSPKLRETLAQVASRKHITGEDVPRFLLNPEAYLPAGVDLSQFSKRVRGLKVVVYNSRPYLHVTKSTGGWLEVEPRIVVEAEVGPEDDESGLIPEVSHRGHQDIPFRDVCDQFRESAEKGEDFVRFRDGWLRVPRNLTRFDTLLQEGIPLSGGRLRIPKRAVLDVYENLEVLEYADGSYLPPGWDPGQLPPFELSSRFRGRLFPHQELGVRWLSLLASRETGGLLADEMGLGKTVQVLAHVARLGERGELQPSLVVCPKTLVPVWCEELNRFLPGAVRFAAIEGGPVAAEMLRKLDLVLCSYDVLRRNQLEMGRVDWQLVVCDEAQYVKNPTAQRTSSTKALKVKHRVALTGTPVENGLVEFWCILDFVAPGLLGSWKQFRDRFERPFSLAEDPEEQERITAELLQNLGHHYLRRAKDEVLRNLPPREFRVLEVPLSPSQLSQYVQIARRAKSAGRGAVLAAIHRLFLVCGHPQTLCGNTEMFGYVAGDCPKLDRTIDLLEDIRKQGEKAIIFTRWIALQEILRAAIEQVFGLPVDVINGRTQGDRTQIVERFSRKPGFNVLILSHDVGGVGLTITAANHVIHYTRPWNPAKEAQATDRVHRIGQEKPVTVYYPIAVCAQFTTVEVRLAELLDAKKDLARNVLRPTSALTVKPEELEDTVEAAGETVDRGWDNVGRATEPDDRLVKPGTVSPRAGWTAIWDACSRLGPGGSPLVHEIPEGATGYSFASIFAPFQRSASKVELCDPHMFQPDSWAGALVEALLVAGQPDTTIRLIGSPPELDEEELVRVQLDMLRGRSAAQGIDLQVKQEAGINESHARFNTGWRLVFSNGFELFHKKGLLLPIVEEEQLATPCRATTIWIYREHVPSSG